ncbi:filamentous haemagglutinin family protein [Methylococcus sp. EFPC2]|uniref:filamentous haemagglutinin family protein n=1 Tax=Methylococcus sp. EFPC2 TaxID=2812648 RepID=UPI001967BD6E|nr:filamentous haemagglutinin family protein [Methylococcus sp. EFPC2]QSA98565.1 filamentous hemagglutinin family protein [Methylococcus sp. EFPC2]
MSRLSRHGSLMPGNPGGVRLRPLSDAVRGLIAGSLALGACPAWSADHAGLPAAIQQVLGNQLHVPELANPGGHASGTYSADGQRLTVQQTTDKAVLEWSRFDIAEGKAVEFKQPSSSAVALNNIHQNDPSRIYGQLTANGQIYLVNQNGFVFGAGSVVNANTLVATTLPVTGDALANGLTKVVDGYGAGEPVAALSGSGEIYRRDAEGGILRDSQGQPQKIGIYVEPGAKIATNAPAGRILIAAPTVRNEGEITADDGQVILAGATDKVYLQEAGADSDLRGVLVEVKTGGSVTNLGKIMAARGDTTLIGFALRQQGIVSASTAVAVNGMVHLQAREGARLETDRNGVRHLKPESSVRPADAGDGLGTRAQVVLAEGSRTSVDLDESGGTAVDEQNQPKSRIDIQGNRITVESGAVIEAKSGTLNLVATQTPNNPLAGTSAANGSRIMLESGSRIDASGSDNTTLPLSRNLVDVELRNYELRDSPIQKTGILHGKTLRVDVRTGTPLADISGATARIQRSVYERNATGGTVKLSSEGDVVVNPDARIDVSGGSVTYQAGYTDTTQLLSNGRVYDIAEADPDRVYDAILGVVEKIYRRWGLTERWDFRRSHYEPGYVQGYDAGGLNIAARNLLFDGSLIAHTLDGIHQRLSADRAKGGSLAIDTAWSGLTQQNVIFQADRLVRPLGENAPFPADETKTRPAPLVINNGIYDNGVRELSINSSGRITIDGNTALEVPADGALKLTGGEIEVSGSLHAPAGEVSLATQYARGSSPSLSGDILIAEGAHIDVSGLWINDSLAGADPSAPVPIGGGKVALQAVGNLSLSAGSAVAAEGGAWLHTDGSLESGRGGEIKLGVAGLRPSALTLDGHLGAQAVDRGGKLEITANAILIGPSADPVPAHTLLISPNLLETGGYADIKLTANGGDIALAPGTSIRLQQRNLQLREEADSAPGGTLLTRIGYPTILPDYVRQPVNLSLALAQDDKVAGYSAARSVGVGENAAILGDTGAKISLSADADIRVDGTLSTPAGRIELAVNAPLTADTGYAADQAIALGPHARLLAPGTAVWQPNSRGLDLGEVKGGGDVVISALRGYILMDRQARIDVSGGSTELDVYAGKSLYARQSIASKAGSIALTAAEGMQLDGSLRGHPGPGEGAAGGNLSLTLDARSRGEGEATSFPAGPRVIHLGAERMPRLEDGWYADPDVPAALNGQAYLSDDQVAEGGFSSLSLQAAVQVPETFSSRPTTPERGEIRFDGDVDLSLARQIVLDSPVLSGSAMDAAERGEVRLSAAYLAVGSTLNRQGSGQVSAGSGRLSLDGGWIDLIGATETRGFGLTALTSSGDIRLRGLNPGQEMNLLGEFSVAGRLDLSARQIYPTTLSRFTLKVDGTLSPDGSLNIGPGDASAATPLAAAGKLSLQAPHIVNRGVLRAPYGEIDIAASASLVLDAASLTSTSVSGRLMPYGRTQGGLDWTYPLGSGTLVLTETPAQGISLSGPRIALNAGATVDFSGGGDLSAFEFIEGPGGSIDRLDPAAPGYRENYAVVPWLGSAYAPYDPLEFPASGLHMGDSVYLSGGGGLPAGYYPLLPAHYALLPGGYLITPQAATEDLRPDASFSRLDGTPVVAGYRYSAGTSERDTRWSGYALETGAIARTRSEYQETTASAFFAQKSAGDDILRAMPNDAGRLTIAAQAELSLAGSIVALAGDGGRGGRVDITAERLAIVPRRNRDGASVDGTVLLAAEELDRLQVESLLVGGRRSRQGDTTHLSLDAASVDLGVGAKLQGPEIILAARNSLRVAEGAEISALGTVPGDIETLRVGTSGDGSGGALLRASAGGQADVVWDDNGLPATTGLLLVDPGAVLRATGSLLLDAAQDTVVRGEIAMEGGALSLGASRISLGDAPMETRGLALSEAQLNRFRADELRLTSRSSIDLYGNLNIGTRRLRLRSAGLYGQGEAGDTARITADDMVLENSLQAVAGAAPAGNGNLRLNAARIELGEGDYALRGFAGIQLAARDALVTAGSSTVAFDADTRLAAGKLSAEAGANAVIDAGEHALTVAPLAGGRPSATNAGLGARLSLRAGTIDHCGTIELPAGSLSLAATGELNLAGGSRIDVGGRSVDLAGNLVYANAGSLSLSSESGNVTAESGSSITLSADPLGGDAGRLSIKAAAGTVRLGGTLSARSNAGYEGGRFSLDASALEGGNFSALNTVLYDAGYSQSLDIRLRSGDLHVAASDRVSAREIRLTADRGKLSVAGTLDASGPEAGRVELAAGGPLSLQTTGRILARSTASGESGGRVMLASAAADGVQGVSVSAGALVDVSGGPGGTGGSVTVRASRVGTDDAAVDIAPGTVAGAAQTDLEAVQTYTDVPLSNATLALWRAETADYVSAALANAGLRARLAGFRLTPGLEVRSSGDLDLALRDAINGETWTRVGSTNVWTTRLGEVAGAVDAVEEKSADGSLRPLQAASSKTLTRDGTYFFDTDPTSTTFRQLYVRVYPDNRLSGTNRYNPARIGYELTESNGWDFSFPAADGSTWRFGPEGTPGVLTVRAAGKLNIDRDLTDGFALYSASQLSRYFGATGSWLPTLMLQPGASWSYRLAAGADLSGADPRAVKHASADSGRDLFVAPGASVRTGTGDIDAAASGDIRLSDWTSTIYTAGRPSDQRRYGSLSNTTVRTAFYAEYPVDGGDISLAAGRDIVGAATPQFMSDWLVRTGHWDPSDGITDGTAQSGDRPTAWGIAYDGIVLASNPVSSLKYGFRENIGALGGGEVSVAAGRDVRDLSVMLPTSAKPVGRVESGRIVENTRQLNGGGDLRVTADGDIVGGVYYVDSGSARLSAAGSITGGSQYTAGPVFALGDAAFDIDAGAGIAVGAVLNPFAVTASKYTDKTAYFTTYSPASAIALRAASGQIRLNNDVSLITKQYLVYSTDQPDGAPVLSEGADDEALLRIYPGTLAAQALSGGIEIDGAFSLYPSPQGNLRLLAREDIELGQAVIVSQSDVDPSQALSPDKPAGSPAGPAQLLDLTRAYLLGFDSTRLHAATPIHVNDLDPVVIAAASGSIEALNDSLVSTAEPAKISAGRDIKGLGLKLQNIADSDVSEIRAGRDLSYPIPRNPTSGQLLPGYQSLEIAGPGQLYVQAGRHVDLGSSEGIFSIGNLSNPGLADFGATLSIFAGLQEQPDYDRFVRSYLENSHAYREPLADYLRARTGDAEPTAETALAAYLALPETRRREWLLAVFFQELKASGLAAAGTSEPGAKAEAYRRGEEAIAALFPSSGYRGDIRLFFSKIHTLDGGDINLLAPGGTINAGLASAFSGAKAPDRLGIVAQREGDINVFLRDDFQVNRSRVFTLDGGDITAWSALGDIDAGRGSKSALAAPAPSYSFDAKGNLVVSLPPAVSGSGIRAQSGSLTGRNAGTARKSTLPHSVLRPARAQALYGDVVLVAPKGIVDAGEAGIGGQNVAIAATAVVGASNIQASGTTTGVPTAVAAPSVPTGADGTLSNAGKAAMQTAGADPMPANGGYRGQAPVLSILSADLIGFGELSVGDVRAGKAGTGR